MFQKRECSIASGKEINLKNHLDGSYLSEWSSSGMVKPENSRIAEPWKFRGADKCAYDVTSNRNFVYKFVVHISKFILLVWEWPLRLWHVICHQRIFQVCVPFYLWCLGFLSLRVHCFFPGGVLKREYCISLQHIHFSIFNLESWFLMQAPPIVDISWVSIFSFK